MANKYLVAVFVGISSVSAIVFKGEATIFRPGLGICGIGGNTDFSAAINSAQLGDHCAGNITVQFQGQSATALVVDVCQDCTPTEIALSPDAFSQLVGFEDDPPPIRVTWFFD